MTAATRATRASTEVRIGDVADKSEVQAIGGSGEAAITRAASVQPQPYDFRTPYKSVAKYPDSLDPLHTAFASALSASLSRHLRSLVDVVFSFSEQLRYDEFLYSLGEVSCLTVLGIDPPGAQALLDLSLPVIYPMIDRLLGGGSSDGAMPIPQRPLTQIEQGLALQIVERAATQLADSWSKAAPMTVREESLEAAPAHARIMPADEIVSAARFEVRIGGAPGIGGLMSLCIPAPVAEYLGDVPAAIPAPAEREAARENLTRNILGAAVELRALLAETKLRLSDVLTMQAGDIITTDKNASAEVPVQLQGKEKFEGRLGQLHGTRAVQITHRVDNPPPKHPSDPGGNAGGSAGGNR